MLKSLHPRLYDIKSLHNICDPSTEAAMPLKMRCSTWKTLKWCRTKQKCWGYFFLHRRVICYSIESAFTRSKALGEHQLVLTALLSTACREGRRWGGRTAGMWWPILGVTQEPLLSHHAFMKNTREKCPHYWFRNLFFVLIFVFNLFYCF